MKRFVLLWILLPLLISGCVVSKKKYDAMVDERNRLDQQLTEVREENKDLRSNLDKALADFEEMKYELHKSNALKSDKVAQLMGESEAFKKETETLKAELDETRRRVRSHQATTAERASELEQMRKRINQLVSDTSSLQYALRQSKERQTKTREEISSLRERYNELSATHQTAKNELEQSKIKLTTIEQQLIEKSQILSDISATFIELRKEMLSAKSSGTPIDPNENRNIDKIARLLGHY